MIIHFFKYSHKLKLFFRATTIHLKADQTKQMLVEDEGRERPALNIWSTLL